MDQSTASIDAAATGAEPVKSRRTIATWFGDLVDWLLGYDVFISYAWDDERVTPYIDELAKALRADGRLRTCVDRTEYHAGMALSQATRRRVRASSMLVLLLRPHAVHSKWVLLELQAAALAGRAIVVVDFDGTFSTIPSESPLCELLDDRLRIAERTTALPSATSLEGIKRAFKFRRKESSVLWILLITSLVLASLATVAGWQAYVATKEANHALSQQIANQAIVLSGDPLTVRRAAAMALDAASRGLANDAENPALFSSAAAWARTVHDLAYAQSAWDVAYCPDGAQVVASAGQHSIRVIDTKTGQQQLQLPIANDYAKQVFCGKDWVLGNDRKMISVWKRSDGSLIWQHPASDGAIAVNAETEQIGLASAKDFKLLDVRTGQVVARREQANDLSVSSRVAMTLDGTMMALTQAHNQVLLLKRRGRDLFPIGKYAVEDNTNVWGLSFSPKGDLLGIAALEESNSDAKMSVVMLSPGKDAVTKRWSSTHRIRRVDPDYYPKQLVAFNRSGLVVIGSVDGSVRVMDAGSGEEISRVRHAHVINDVAWLPNDIYFASASYDGTACIWEAVSAYKVSCTTHGGGSGSSSVESLAVSPDGRYLATASWDHSVRISETRGAATPPFRVANSFGLAYGSAGRYLVTGIGDARIWSKQTGHLEDVTPRGRTWHALTVASGGQWAAGVDSAGDLYVCNGPDCFPTLGTSPPILSKAIDLISSADGGWLGVRTDAGLRVYRPSDWNVWSIPGSASEFVLSPSGTYVAARGNKEVTIVRTLTGQRVKTASVKGGVSVCFDADERWVAIATTEDQTSLIDLGGNWVSPPIQLKGLVACDPSGKSIVTRSADSSTLEVRNVADGRLVRTLPYSNAVAFDAEGRHIATSNGNRTHVWTLDGRVVMSRSHDAGAHVNAVVFSPDGESLAYVDSDNTAHWHMWPGTALVREIQRRIDNMPHK